MRTILGIAGVAGAAGLVWFLLKDESGNLVSGSKFIEVHFRDGKVTQMGHEFGLGRAHTQTN